MSEDARQSYSRRQAYIETLPHDLEVCGDLCVLRTHQQHHLERRRKIRGLCVDFSQAARLRMLKTVACIDWSRISNGVFVTLTTPEDIGIPNKQQRNAMLYVFLRMVEKYLDRLVGVLWRIEWMKRLSGRNVGQVYPHFHLIIPNVRYIGKSYIRDFWYKATGTQEEAITWIDKLGDRKKHEVYIAKYAAKPSSLGVLDYVSYLNNAGRHWGIRRRSLIPFHVKRIYKDLDAETVKRLRRIGSSVLPFYKFSDKGGFSLFGKFGRNLVAACEKLAIAGCDHQE